MTTDHDLHGYQNEIGPCVCAKCEAAHNAPHPDTARADAAERMLYLTVERCRTSSVHGMDIVTGSVPGLSEWIIKNAERIAATCRRADLTAKLADAEATAARLRAELAALTSAASPGG